MVQDLSYNLCESLVENIGGVADTGKRTPPTPIIYLTQWRMMGNSTVHTDEYLTQWKVEGNSVVDNNAILSCGDLGQDGYYHVKISNGVTIYDIALTEPLRKVNSVADKIEFSNGTAVITRNIASRYMSTLRWSNRYISAKDLYRYSASAPDDMKRASDSHVATNILCAIYTTQPVSYMWNADREGIGLGKETDPVIYLYDSNYNGADMTDAFKAHLQGVELIYEVATPTTEVIQVSPFPISPTDTYTSVNDTPYSAFEYKKNVEIWSCGEYSEVDGKYHILVQPLGGSIADIALDAPLREVGDVADNIEFPSDTEGKALVTRNTSSIDLGTCTYRSTTNGFCSENITDSALKPVSGKSMDVLCAAYPNAVMPWQAGCMGITTSGAIWIADKSYESTDAIKNALAGVEMIYKLATPTTELVDAPQIQEADSYSCVISQGGKAVSWSSFTTE